MYKDNMKFDIISIWGNDEDCVITLNVDGKNIKRMGKAPKGIFKTSVYGTKLTVDINTKTFV